MDDTQTQQVLEPGTPPPSPPSRRYGRWIGAVAGGLALLLGLVIWYVQRPATPPPGNLTIAQREEVFLAFWNMAKQEYPDLVAKQIDWDKVRTTTLQQLRKAPDDTAFDHVMLRAVAQLQDTHDWLLTPHNQSRNANLLLAMAGDTIVIRQVVPGTDAVQAGLQAGMEIVSVDGKPAAQVWREKAAEASDSTPYRNRWAAARTVLIGPADRPVTVQARSSAGQVVTATLQRNSQGIPFAPFAGKTLAGGVRYLKVGTFDDGVVMAQAISYLQQVAREQPPGLIIDLRGNPGGSIAFGESMLSFLSGKSVPVTYEVGKSTGIVGPSMSEPQPQVYAGPTLLLTDPGCVSACDIFTAVMARNGLAKLVGEPPAGATWIANDRKLPHGYVIHMSGGRGILGPDKQRIEGNPAPVAYPLAPTAADWAAGRDPVLAKALQLLTK